MSNTSIHAQTRLSSKALRWLIGLLAVTVGGLLTNAAQAELTARLSSPQIDETQTLELIIRTESRDVQGIPDLTPIKTDFEVLTTRTSSQYRVINGNVQAWTEWIIALRPLRTGTLRVPQLTYRNEVTKPLTLRVVPLDPALKKQLNNRVFFETSIAPENPYVQAQTIYTRRLLYEDGTQIYGEMPDTPVIENAVVLVLGNAKSSTVERNGRRYGMIEQRYAIFPERSGEFRIPGAMVSGSVRMRINNRLRRNGVRVIAEPTTLKVRPIPQNYPKNTPWLPATEVTLLEAWDNSPPVFKLGESLRQTLIVRSDSATGSLIPPLDYAIPESHFRAYPEQPDIADNRASTGSAGVIGTRSQSWSLIPTAEGAISLPAVSLTWFNTSTDRIETSVLPQRDLRVFGPVNRAAPDAGSAPDSEPAAEPVATADAPGPVDVSQRRVFGPWLIALTIASIGVVGWFARQLLRRSTFYNGSSRGGPAELARRLQPQFLRLRNARAALADTLTNGSASEIRVAVKDTVQDYAGAGRPVNAQALAELYTTLDTAHYARVTREPDRQKLHALADELFSQPKQSSERLALPELYG